MKYNLLLPLLSIYCFATAQSTCDYKINVDTQEEIFQLTQESLIDFTVRREKNNICVLLTNETRQCESLWC